MMASSIRLDKHWWQELKRNAHGKLFETVKRLDGVLQRENALKRQLQILHNRTYGGLGPGSCRYNRDSLERDNTLIVNTMANLHQTIRARVCVDRPRPQFMTDGGCWSERRRARKLDKFVLGEFHKNSTYEKAEQAFDDSMWADTGFLKVHGADRVIHERVFPTEILVDEQGALTCDPRSIYQVRNVPAEVLMARYPESKDAIARSVNGRLHSYSGDRSTVVATDLVLVAEAYHLRSADGANDGRLIIAVEEGCLVDEPWDEDWHPYVPIRWYRLPIGYYGMSFVEQQAPIQRESNTLFGRFQEAFNINAGRVFAEEGSIDRDHITNRPGDITWVKKTAKRWPSVHTPGSMPADTYQHAWNLIRTQHEVSGTSQMSATGQKPGGDLSGIALNTLQNVETQRHGLEVRAYQRFIMEIADRTVKVAKRIYQGNPDYKTSYVGKRFVQTIEWKEVAIDHYVLQHWPTNLLPATPAGKLATTQELLAAGLIPPDVARMLLDFPDIEGINFEAAEMEFIDFIAEKMLDGEKWPPEDYQANLGVAIRRIGQHIMLAHMDGAKTDDVRPLKDWIAVAILEMEKRKARMQAFMQQAQQELNPPAPAPAASGPQGVALRGV